MKFLKAKDKKPYGDVEYADPADGKYPIDTEEHIRAAWNYINKPKNYAALGDKAAGTKAKIVAAWKKKIDPDGPPSAAKKNLGQSDAGLMDSLYAPDPLLDVDLPEGLMVVPEPMGYNSTDLCLELCVQDGRLSARRLTMSNYDSDPNGREEEPGSADEAREQAHYATVMAVVAAFLGAGEPEGAVAEKAASPDEEGEALDDVSPSGKKRSPKEACDYKGVEVALA